MIMEFYLNKKKAEALGYTVEACYEVIDRIFAEYGIKPEGQGFYNLDTQAMFDACAAALIRLPKSSWFLKVVDEWYWRVESDDISEREDCLAGYYRYNN